MTDFEDLSTAWHFHGRCCWWPEPTSLEKNTNFVGVFAPKKRALNSGEDSSLSLSLHICILYIHPPTETKILLMVQKSGLPVEVGSLSHYEQGFTHPTWCRISSINSSTWKWMGPEGELPFWGKRPSFRGYGCSFQGVQILWIHM